MYTRPIVLRDHEYSKNSGFYHGSRDLMWSLDGIMKYSTLHTARMEAILESENAICNLAKRMPNPGGCTRYGSEMLQVSLDIPTRMHLRD
jgi:hypothetical protein